MNFKLTKNTKSILIVVMVLVAVLIALSLWSSKGKNHYSSGDYGMMYQGLDNDNAQYASFEQYANGGDGPKVMLFHATWCGHCEKYLSSGIFDKVSGSKDVQGVSFHKLDADKNEDLREKYDVTSFPTILGVNSKGEKVGFEGNRNMESDLVSFAKSLMS
jgi:thiol-disulfide isomerase/thioredoxin